MSHLARGDKPILIDSRRVDIGELLENARLASAFLKALANESRLVILCLLAEGEKSVMELAELLGERQPTVSQQLARLKSEDFVEARRDGKHIFYSLAREEVRDIILTLHATFCPPVPRPRKLSAQPSRPRPATARPGRAGSR